jgi:hypothetical protein
MTRMGDQRSSATGPGRRVEFVRFHVHPDETSSVLEARRAWSAAHRGGEGYLGGLLVAFDDDEWLEITVWDEALPRDPGSTDRAGAGFVDGIAGPRTEIVGQETGDLALVDPLTPLGNDAPLTSMVRKRP